MMQPKHTRPIGISGLAGYIPPYRVWLKDWCEWTDNQWPKIQEVVGRSFRVRGPNHSMYTMAANAVIRLIDQYDVDPARVKFLGLGTESSTDNSAGAIIVKGMVDEALAVRGLPPIARSCEVPEFKHACLGGVYGMKGAIRHLALDGAGGQAIVVCADIAEYARGSSGEPTQGAGAVAMLLEEEPQLAVVDLIGSGSASDYRLMDFRKHGINVNAGGLAVAGEFGTPGVTTSTKGEQVGNGPTGLRHTPVGPVHEYGPQRTKVLRRIEVALLVHVGERLQGLVDVAGRRILAVKYREILNVVRL